MPRRPYMRFFPTDWLVGTRDLSTAEKGLYIDLIALNWLDGKLPKDSRLIASKLGINPKLIRNLLGVNFELTTNLGKHFVSVNEHEVTNKRVSEELRRYKNGSPNQKQNQKQNHRSDCAPPNVRTKGASSARRRGGPPESIGRVLGAEEFERKRQGALRRLKKAKA